MGDDYANFIVGREHLAKLPRWAIIALATRCARRVQPLFRAHWPAAPAEYDRGIEYTLSLIEAVAVVGGPAKGKEELRRALNDLAEKMMEIADEATQLATASSAFPSVSTHAAAAVSAAASAAGALFLSDAQSSAMDAREEERVALEQSMWEAGSAFQHALSAARTVASANAWDYFIALHLAQGLGWTHESPVDPNLFGRLWPASGTASLPVKTHSHDGLGGLVVEFEVPDGVSDEQAAKLMEGYLLRLNQLHRALGGQGLRISPPSEVLEPALEGAVR
jgi:hypothetical protein